MSEGNENQPVATLMSFAEGQKQRNRFQIGAHQIALIKSFRYLPAQRLTALANLDDADVVVKCFFGAKAQTSYAREVAGLKALEQAGIPTPSRQLELESATDELSLLALHYLEDCQTLRQKLNDANEQGIVELLQSAVDVFVRLHQAGLTQPDPHLDNFLWHQQTLYMIDAGMIEKTDQPLARETALDNLALFFAQLPPHLDRLTQLPLAQYFNAMGFSADDAEAWDARLLAQRRWREQRFVDKKVFRNCTAFQKQASFRQFMVWDRARCDQAVQQEMQRPRILFEQGERCEDLPEVSRIVQISGQTYRLDRFAVMGFGWSPAALAWRNAQRLALLGIPMLRPVCLYESRLGPFRTDSYLLSEWSEASTLQNCMTNGVLSEGLRAKVTALLNGLERCDLIHGRLSQQAILESEGRYVLGDVQDLRHLDGSASDQALQQQEQALLLASMSNESPGLN